MSFDPAGRRGANAFSLIEVVIAIALFSFAVTSILGLLPLTAREAAASRDLRTAAGLCDSIQLEAQQSVPVAGFSGFASLQLVAARDGTGLRPLDPTATAGEEYFLVELAPYVHAPLQYQPDRPLLALTAKVSWPYRSPAGGIPVIGNSAGGRERFSFVFALRP